MGSSRISNFLEVQRAREATIGSAGCGDSRYRRLGGGESLARVKALKTACGGLVGGFVGFNQFFSQGANRGEGVENFFRRANNVPSNVLGVNQGAPAGCLGIPYMAQANAVGENELSGSLTETSTSSITLTGDVSWWPTSNVFIRVGNEMIYATTRSGQVLSTITRGAYGSAPAAHSAGDAVGLCTADNNPGDVWLQNMHAWLRHSTVATLGCLDVAVSGGTGTGTFAVSDATGWPTGSFIVKIDSEILNISSRSGNTLTVANRGWFGGGSAAPHSLAAEVGIANYDPHYFIGMGMDSEIGCLGPGRYFFTVENPDGTSHAGARLIPTVYIGDEPMSAISTIGAAVATSGSINPTWAGNAGEIGGHGLDVRPSNSLANKGIWAGLYSGSLCPAGPAVLCWQGYRSRGRRGGMLQGSIASQGGRKSWDFISNLARSAAQQLGYVKMFQFVRWASATANGGSGRSAYVWDWQMGANDTYDQRLAWVTLAQEWTVQHELECVAAIDPSDTELELDDASALPNQGHLLVRETGERISWTSKTSDTLQGLVRGDFITTPDDVPAGAGILVGWQSRDPLGLPANLIYAHAILADCWDAADISASNATSPIVETGSWNMLSPETGAPDSDAEFFMLWARQKTQWPTATYPAPGAAVSTLEDIEGRMRQWVDAVRTNAMAAVANLDVADLGPATVTADDLALNGYCDVSVATTLNGAITDTATSIAVTSASGVATQGYAWIEKELVRYGSRSGNTLQTVTRGVGGTTAAAHSNGVPCDIMDTIHQSQRGSIETWLRWSAANLAGSAAPSGVEFSDASLRQAKEW